MHEMSLVISILDLAEAEARAAAARVINGITVEVGALAGVQTDALEFCFTAARKETLAAQATLTIDVIAGRGVCPICGQESAAESLPAVCRHCEAGVLDIRQGRELRLRSINVD